MKTGINGLEKLILLKCQYYKKPPIASVQSLQDSNGIFFIEVDTKISKMYMESQKSKEKNQTLTSQINPEKEQQIRRQYTFWF